jgi:hypothetical protein
MISPFSLCLVASQDSNANRSVPVRGPAYVITWRRKASLFRKDELIFLGKTEIGHSFVVGPKPRPIVFVGGEIVERNQRKGNVVGPFMRHPVADQTAAAAWNDAEPAFGILLEHRALEGIDLVADENGHGHGNLAKVF